MKSVVITGSTRGIGLAMAVEFLRAGCQVTLSGRGETLPEEAAAQLADYQTRYFYVQCDVQYKESLQNLWDMAVARWQRIDLWINNAGQNAPYACVWDTDEMMTGHVISTNLTGMIYGSQVAAAAMIKQGYGAIYSMEGLGSNNMIQLKTVLYGTTNHALTYFMRGLARELEGSGVIAGRLSPGMMLTDFITRSPDGRPSEVVSDRKFKKVFNILADRPETVAAFFIPRILRNTKNDHQIIWLTKSKAAWRFMTARRRRDRLI